MDRHAAPVGIEQQILAKQREVKPTDPPKKKPRK